MLLDISVEQKILNIKVKSSPKIEAKLKNLLIGQGLDVAMRLSDVDLNGDQTFFVVELELLQEAILTFIGVTLPDSLAKGYQLEELVCRCFGIYQRDIKAFLHGKDLPQLTLMHLTEELSAGAACGSCLEDLKLYLAQGKHQLLPFPATPPVDAAGKRLRVSGLTPREVAELLAEQLPDKSIEIMLVRPPFVLIRSKGRRPSPRQLQDLATWAEEKLFLHLEFRLL